MKPAKKVLTTAVFVILALAAVGLYARGNVYKNRVKALEKDVKALQRQVVEVESQRLLWKNTQAAKSKKAETQRAPGPPPFERARQDEPSVTAPEAKASRPRKDFAQDPSMRARQKEELYETHRELLASLNLPPKDQDVFMDLLLDKRLAFMQLAFARANEDPNTREGIEALDQAQENFFSAGENLQEFLGQARYEIYDQFEDYRPERERVAKASQDLEAEGLGLSANQKTTLVNILNDERKAFVYLAKVRSPLDVTLLSPDERDLYYEEVEAYARQVSERAASVLSPDQTKAFTQSLEAFEKERQKAIQGLLGNAHEPSL